MLNRNRDILNQSYVLLRTVTRDAKGEMGILANTTNGMNVLTTPSTMTFPNGPRYNTISSVQTPVATKKKWGGKSNLIFSPSIEDTQSRIGTSLVLNYPASLHTCRTGDLIDTFDAENPSLKEDLSTRFKEFGTNLNDYWDKDVVRDDTNKGMYGKYTELILHPQAQGKMLYQRALDAIEPLKNIFAGNNREDIIKYIADNTVKNMPPEQEKGMIESIKNYVKFLKSTKKEDESPNLIKAFNDYEKSNHAGFFNSLDNQTYKLLREEILNHYLRNLNQGMRHNEFIGRLFPWEIEGVDIGHIDNINDTNKVISKIAQTKRFINNFNKLREDLLNDISNHGLEHYMLKEFFEAKNKILADQGAQPLNFDEKNEIVNKITQKLKHKLESYSYQEGILKKCDFVEDLEHLKEPVIQTLNEEKYLSISNELRLLGGLSTITTWNIQETIHSTPELIAKARVAVRYFLDENIDFALTGSKEDSGALILDILKNKYPDLSDRQIIENNLDNFDIDTCLSIISSACYMNPEIKSKYEHNDSSPIKLESESIVTSMLNYSIDIFMSYCDKHPELDEKRPLCDFSVSGYSLPFHNMQYETKNNLIDAWEQKKSEPFKSKIKKFIDDAYTEYAVDLSDLLNNDHLPDVWNKIIIKQEEVFGKPSKEIDAYQLTRSFFKCLGGAWSRSEEIADESIFRKLDNKQDWLQNPFGEKYRQHETGRGALTTLAPSQNAIDIAKNEIIKGCRPFQSSEDMYAILQKVHNPIDKFGLYVIFLNINICAAVSGTAIRIINLWDEITKKIKNRGDDVSELPSIETMKKLCHIYLTGSKNHHTPIEVDLSLLNRRR